MALDLAQYVTSLVENLRQSYGSAATVHCDLAPLEVDADRAQSLGLIVSEVVANALKHALPDGRPGRITVTLAPSEGGAGRLSIEDDGVGAAREEQMGMRLVQALARQLGAEYAYDSRNGGTSFVLTFPLTAASAG